MCRCVNFGASPNDTHSVPYHRPHHVRLLTVPMSCPNPFFHISGSNGMTVQALCRVNFDNSRPRSIVREIVGRQRGSHSRRRHCL